MLRVTVEYDDAIGTGRVATSASTLPVDRPGVVVLTTNAPLVGQEVTATLMDGDGGILNEEWEWESSPDQETLSWSPIAGVESGTYEPTEAVAGRVLRAKVTYDDETGRGREAVSAVTEVVDRAGMLSLSTSNPVVGEAVTATLSDADGGVGDESWEWESSADQVPLDWSVIQGADTATYVPIADIAGRLVRARVTYNDGVGTGRSATSSVTEAVDQRGALTLLPERPVVGEAVEAVLTDADGDVSEVVWQWERSPGVDEPVWSDINGAASFSYTPVAPDDVGHILRVTVTYTDGVGSGRSATATTNNKVDQRGEAILSTSVPDVGMAVMATLVDSDGGVTGASWQWQSSPSTATVTWSDIAGATASAYTVTTADEGALLRVTVGYHDAVGNNRNAVSVASQKVGKPGNVNLDSSMPVVGEMISATLTDADGSTSNEEWLWEISPAQENPEWKPIADADSRGYMPVAGDAGLLLRATVVYTDDSGVGRMARSTTTAKVDTRGTVTLSPSPPVVGEPAKATLTDADGSIANQVWRWERSPGSGEPEWTPINGAHSSSYKPAEDDDSGKLLRVVVTYDDGTGTDRSASSLATERVDRRGVVTVSPAPPVAGQLLTATLTDADGSITNHVWKWERSSRTGTPVWTEIAGATAASYTPLATDDGGKILRATVTYDDGIGIGRIATSDSTLAVDRPGMVSLSTTTPVVGERVTATLKDEDGGLSNEVWQWESSPEQQTPEWTEVTGAEASTYTPTASLAGRLFRVVVRYEDATGRGREAASNSTAPLDQRGVVTLSLMAPIVGQAVTATLTDADGSIANEDWAWKSSQSGLEWEAVPDADSATYIPTPDDAGRLLKVQVLYDDGIGTGRSAISGATAAVDQRGLVTLSHNTPVVGEELTAILADADGDVSDEVWRWERSPALGEPVWSEINSAESFGYTPTASGDAGQILRVVVTYADGTGTGKSATSAVTNRVDQRGMVTLSTNVPDVGVVVAATLADPDKGLTGQVWQWQSSPSTGTPSWSDIAEATVSTYTPTTANEGNLLRVVVGYDDAIGMGRSLTSASSEKVGKPGVVRLDSTALVVGRAINATLADADGDVSNQVWKWESSLARGNLEWSPISGADSPTYTPVPRDAGRLLRMTVTYTDGSGTGRIASSSPTAKVDNLPPVFREGETTEREIALGWAGAKAGAPVTATDHEGDGLTYLLTGEGSAFFKVDPGTGQVSIDDGLVFLWPGTYRVVLHAIDSAKGMASIELRITVTQFSVPVFQESDRAIRWVLENLPAGALVGFPVRARDRDGDTLLYSLSGGDEDAFELNTATGQISTRRAMDREDRSKYEVILRAEDGRGGYDSIQVDIEVVDENEPPVLNEVPSGLVIDEDSVIGTPIGTPIGARDPEQDSLSYSLSGVEANVFGIDQKTGQLVTTGILDYETRPDYRFIARVEDGRGGSDEITVTVGVADVNEAPSFGPKRVVELAVPENSPVGAIVGGPLLAKDPEDDRLVYSMSGDGVGAFDIDAAEGFVVSKATLDYESRTSYLVQVSAVDGGGRSDSIYVSILVTDVEEQASDPDKGDGIAESMTSSSPSSASADSQLGSTADGSATGPHADYGNGLDPDVGQPPAGPSAYGEPVSTPVPVGEKESHPIPVSSMPHHSPSTRDRADAAESTVVLSNDVDENVLPTSPTGSLAILLSNNALTVPDQMPLWLVLALLVLPYIDGILLIILLYRR